MFSSLCENYYYCLCGVGKVSVTLTRVFPHPSAAPSNPSASTHDIPLAYLDLQVSVSKVRKVSGDASTLFNRGKKKYIYDYSAECEWRLEAAVHPCGGDFKDSVVTAHGVMTVNDITTGDEECEIGVEVTGSTNTSRGTITNQEVQGLINKHVKGSAHKQSSSPVESLPAAVRETLKRFDADFKAVK